MALSLFVVCRVLLCVAVRSSLFVAVVGVRHRGLLFAVLVLVRYCNLLCVGCCFRRRRCCVFAVVIGVVWCCCLMLKLLFVGCCL